VDLKADQTPRVQLGGGTLILIANHRHDVLSLMNDRLKQESEKSP